MDDIKDVAKAIIEPILNFAVKNSKDEDGKKDDVKNEKVDKRDIIRQIMAIAGKEEASEDVKTIAKLAEKLAYDDSEAGTADNKKAKNEDKANEPNGSRSREEKEEKFEEEKEIASNKKCKNEEKEKEEDKKEDDKAENKCKNSMDEVRKAVFGGQSSNQNSGYLTKAQRIELGNNY